MRTQDQIAARIAATRADDFFGFRVGTLVPYLYFDRARPYLRDGAKREDVEGGDDPWPRPQGRDALVAVIRDYLAFAVGKAIDHRGLSAGRSVENLEEWVWLLGDADHAAIDWGRFPNYGAPILKQIVDHLGLAVDGADDPAFLSMARGDRCRPGCQEGCGE